MNIILAMPGKQANQRRLWDWFIDAGLDQHTALAFQANAKWHDQYPADLLAAHPDHDSIAHEQYNHTRVRLDDDYQPKPYAYTYLDYEPKKPHLTGPDSAWGWRKQEDGFSDDDTKVLAQMRRGVQEATDGLPFSIYRTPVLKSTKAPDPAIVKSARESLEPCEWVWMHAYPDRQLLHSTIGEWHDNLVRQFGALSKLGRRVVPWVWPSHSLTTDQAAVYGAATIKSLTMIPGITHLGIWVDCQRETTTDRQIANLESMKPYLRQFVEHDAGEPQGTD